MISITVPVYNTEEYLNQCLDSILNQTLKDIEIICMDDGSTDKSAQIMDAYATQDSSIHVLHKENGGLDMYECLLTALINENVDTAMCGRFEDSGESSRAMYHGFDEGRYDKTKLMQFVYPNMMVNKYFFERGNFLGLWDKLFRRECLEDFQMAVEERLAMGEDAVCVYPCLLQADRNHAKLQEQGFEAIPPEAVGEYEDDAIVVAVSFYKMRIAYIRSFPYVVPRRRYI